MYWCPAAVCRGRQSKNATPCCTKYHTKAFGSDGDSKLQACVARDDMLHHGVAAITSDHEATRMLEGQSWNMLHEPRDVHS